jgi:hypothetical protein
MVRPHGRQAPKVLFSCRPHGLGAIRAGGLFVQRKAWEKPELTFEGTIDEVVLLGGGKLSAIGGDPGEPRKPPGQG